MMNEVCIFRLMRYVASRPVILDERSEEEDPMVNIHYFTNDKSSEWMARYNLGRDEIWLIPLTAISDEK